MKRTAISRRPSKAKRQFDAEYAKMLPSVLARGCEMPVAHLAHPEVWRYASSEGPCRGRLIGHHVKGRRGADANEPGNVRCLCDAHHKWVHANPAASRDLGLMLSRVS